MTTTAATWTKSRTGYTTNLTAASGRVFRVQATKGETGNASVRGGAYRTEWTAVHGVTKGKGETRTAALDALVAAYAKRGIHLS